MHYKNTLGAISISLDDVQRLILKISDEGNITSIDLDLAADKMRHIYDLLLSLKTEYPTYRTNLNVANLPVEAIQEPEPAAKEEVIPKEEPKPEPVIIPVPEPVKPAEPEKTIISEPVRHVVTSENVSSAKINEEKRLIGDFLLGKPTLAEELAGHNQMSNVTDKLKSKPISSIASAIGLNEKFELMQNLFKGNKENYEHTMNALNMAANYNEAYDYLANSLKFDMENEYVQRLLELIRRKLIVLKNEQ